MPASDGKRQIWIIPGESPGGFVPIPADRAPGHRVVAAPIARRQRRSETRPLRLLARLYGLGPLGALFGGATRGEQILAGTALGAGVLWLLLQLPPVAAGLPALPRLGLALLCGGLALAAWSRELALAAGQRRLNRDRLPAWMRGSGGAALLGLTLPGFGLLLAGRARRAALAFVNAGLTLGALCAAAGLILTPGPGKPSAAVELCLGGTLLAVALGALLWVAGALDGGRLLANAARRPRAVPADRFALALLLALMLFGAAFDPAELASDLDAIAASLQARDFRHVPLACELWALRLDPSRPEYALRAADLAAASDRPTLAGALLYSVRERWQVCTVRFGREWPRRPRLDGHAAVGAALPQ
ncbi:hypothetical protein FJ251_02475 [bacterium]|nr:hypothetical protein [bacterium]